MRFLNQNGCIVFRVEANWDIWIVGVKKLKRITNPSELYCIYDFFSPTHSVRGIYIQAYEKTQDYKNHKSDIANYLKLRLLAYHFCILMTCKTVLFITLLSMKEIDPTGNEFNAGPRVKKFTDYTIFTRTFASTSSFHHICGRVLYYSVSTPYIFPIASLPLNWKRYYQNLRHRFEIQSR